MGLGYPHGVGTPLLGGVSSSALRWFKKTKRAPLPQHRAPGAHIVGLGVFGPLPRDWMPVEKGQERLEKHLPQWGFLWREGCLRA